LGVFTHYRINALRILYRNNYEPDYVMEREKEREITAIQVHKSLRQLLCVGVGGKRQSTMKFCSQYRISRA